VSALDLGGSGYFVRVLSGSRLVKRKAKNVIFLNLNKYLYYFQHNLKIKTPFDIIENHVKNVISFRVQFISSNVETKTVKISLFFYSKGSAFVF